MSFFPFTKGNLVGFLTGMALENHHAQNVSGLLVLSLKRDAPPTLSPGSASGRFFQNNLPW